MIWVRGELVQDDALCVNVLDRTFEHGLGLFETFRTWNGNASLLPLHLARLQASAQALGLPLDPGQLPDETAVEQFLELNKVSKSLGPARDLRMRITLSGGLATAAYGSSMVWMTAAPLPTPIRTPGAVITGYTAIGADDPLARHKTLNHWRKRIAYAEATTQGSDEVLCVTGDRLVCEGTRTNLFLVTGRWLRTPGLEQPLLPGIMRRVVLDRAAKLGIEVREGPLTFQQLFAADEAFLTSSVRGMLPIASLLGSELAAPGPLTRRLWNDILPWLDAGGGPQ
jgi:branched-subunit amino acid aminotransferase/4-amino-4-deoxychorismate lyase